MGLISIRFLKKAVLITSLILISAITLSVIFFLNPSDTEIAKRYIEDKGYTIVSYNGPLPKQILTKKIASRNNIWLVQSFDTRPFVGKTVAFEWFTVKNHPLDNWQQTDGWGKLLWRAKGQTNICILIVDKKAIGGISAPVLDQVLLGGLWSLDGKTFEQIHPEVKKLGYPKWQKLWEEKFQ